MSAAQWGALVLLGGAGAVARAVLAAAAGAHGILLVNVSGALALGVLDGAGAASGVLLLAGTGFLGAYTTFSTWMHEAAGSDRATRALLVPLAAGLAAAALGHVTGAGLA